MMEVVHDNRAYIQGPIYIAINVKVALRAVFVSFSWQNPRIAGVNSTKSIVDIKYLEFIYLAPDIQSRYPKKLH